MKTLRAYTAYLILSVVLICLTVFGATPLWAAESESGQTASYSVTVSAEGQKAVVDDSPYAADESLAPIKALIENRWRISRIYLHSAPRQYDRTDRRRLICCCSRSAIPA